METVFAAKVLFIDEISSMTTDLFEFIWYVLKIVREHQQINFSSLTDSNLDVMFNSSIKGLLVIVVGDVMQNLPISLKKDDIDFLKKFHAYVRSGDFPFFNSIIFNNNFKIAMIFDGHHRGPSSRFVELSMKARVNRFSKDEMTEYMILVGGSIFTFPQDTWPKKIAEESNLKRMVAQANQQEQFKKGPNSYLISSKKIIQKRLDEVFRVASLPFDQSQLQFDDSKCLVLTGENGVIAQYSKFKIKDLTSYIATNQNYFAKDVFSYRYGRGIGEITQSLELDLKR